MKEIKNKIYRQMPETFTRLFIFLATITAISAVDCSTAV